MKVLNFNDILNYMTANPKISLYDLSKAFSVCEPKMRDTIKENDTAFSIMKFKANDCKIEALGRGEKANLKHHISIWTSEIESLEAQEKGGKKNSFRKEFGVSFDKMMAIIDPSKIEDTSETLLVNRDIPQSPIHQGAKHFDLSLKIHKMLTFLIKEEGLTEKFKKECEK